ncbi:hypothetical protein NPIL_209261, partial [Nephila pilipes]
ACYRQVNPKYNRYQMISSKLMGKQSYPHYRDTKVLSSNGS